MTATALVLVVVTALTMPIATTQSGPNGPPKPAPTARDQSSTLRGIITDATTGAPIADARVALTGTGPSVRTAVDGKFDFPGIKSGTYTLTVSRIGYIFVRRQVDVVINSVVELTVPLSEGTGTYQENVTVTADPTPSRDVGVSSQASLGSAGLQELRGVAADDPMRAMQALPGVATGDDFQAQFSVRGSQFRHVGFVLDGTPTPLLLHAIRGLEDSGSIAMVNTDVLSKAALAAGARPMTHGDWIGATVEFETRDGSRDRTAARMAISGTSASAVVEGPIGTGKHASWLFSVRKSYLDWLVRKVEPTIDDTIGFSDAQAKVVVDLTGRQQMEFLVMGGRATFRQESATSINQLFKATSSGGLISFGWRYAGNRALWRQRISLVSNTYRDSGRVGQQIGRGTAQAASWRGDATWFLNDAVTVDAGLRAEAQFNSEIARVFQGSANAPIVRTQLNHKAVVTLTNTWGQVTMRTGRGGIIAGLHATHDTLGPWTRTSPWILAEQHFGTFTLRGGIGGAAQFLELSLQRPTTAPKLQPERAWASDLSLEHQITSTIRWQITAFNRDDSHIVRRIGEDRLVNGVRVFETPFLQYSTTLEGGGHGADVVVERHATSGLTGWIGYSYARTRHHDTSTGETFDGDFDQRHTLNVFAQQRLSYRLAVSMKLRVGSNFPISGYFDGEPLALKLGSDRNTVRLPLYSRLDLRADRTFTFDRGRLTLFVELMNTLNRDNYGQSAGTIRSTGEAVFFVQKLIPRVPSAGLLFEF